MISSPYLSVAELPPKPDPETGEPRPPRAPAYGRDGEPPKEHDKNRVTDPAKAPSPPEGQGPVLVWYKPSSLQKWGVGGTGFLMLVVGFTIMQGFDLRWMTAWWMWLIALVFAALIGGSVRGSECSVGAEWLQRKGGGWVRLYELKKITGHRRSNALHLDFEDQDGRVVQISTSDLHHDPGMWDLVYNGMLHSVIAGGAETNGRLHAALDLPRPWPHA